MWLIILISVQLIIMSSSSLTEDMNCYFNVLYSNGSRFWCFDEECSNHLDIISIEDLQCRTNYLSLRFSSYLTYSKFLLSTSSRIPLSSFFSMGRPNIERLLQIEFLSPLENADPFKLDQLSLLSHSISNIDTYELVFYGQIAKDNMKLFLDKNIFLSDEQQFIDTLRLRFNCNENESVEWELIKSIQSLPDSPCPQQIQFLNHQNSFHLIILTSGIAFVCIIVIISISLGLYYYYSDHHRVKLSNSRIELITTIQRF